MKKAHHLQDALPEDVLARDTAEVPAVQGQTAESLSAESPPAGPLPAVSPPSEARTPEPRTPEHWTVDGLEDSPRGPLARLEREDGTTFDLPLRLLPEGLREGDLLAVQDGPDGVTVRVLVGETLERHESAQAQLEALNSAESDLQDEDGEITV